MVKRTSGRFWPVGRESFHAEQRFKDAARSYASVYKRSGLLVPKPCERCGSPDVEMHHLDYARPLAVRWLCREHRMELRGIGYRTPKNACTPTLTHASSTGSLSGGAASTNPTNAR